MTTEGIVIKKRKDENLDSEIEKIQNKPKTTGDTSSIIYAK